MKKTEDKCQAYLNLIEAIIVAIDSDEKITYINKKGCDILGCPEEGVIGKNWFDHFLPTWDRDRVRSTFQMLMQGAMETVEYFENPVLTKDGREIIIGWHNALIKDETGNLIGTISSGQDVSDREKAKSELEDLAKFPSENPNPVLRLGKDKTVLYSNKAAKDLLSGDNIKVGKIASERWCALIGDVLKEGLKKSNIETQEKGKTFLWMIVPVVGKSYINIYGIDITDRKKIFEALRISEEKYSKTFHVVPVLISLSSLKDGRYYEVNDTFCKVLEFSREEVIGKTSVELGIFKDAKERRNMAEIMKTKGSVRDLVLSIITKSKKELIVLFSAEMIDIENEKYILAAVKDITERRKAREALLETDRKYHLITENTSDFIALTKFNPQVIFTYVSPSYVRILGFEKEELLGKSALSFIHPDDVKKLIPLLNRYLKMKAREFFTGKGSEIFETFRYRIKKKSGGWVVLESTTDVVGNELLYVSKNVTEKVKMEEILQESEIRFRELFNNMSSGVAVYEATDQGNDFRFKDINKSGEHISQVRKEDIIGKRVTELFPRIKETGLLNIFQRVYKTGNAEFFETTHYKDNCIDQWVENFVYRLPTSEVVVVYDDVTERKQAEKELKEAQNQLLQTEKMSAIGQLSAGVAHEVKNPLSVILLSIESLEGQLANLNEKNKRHIRMIKDSANRANKVVVDLLNFSRYSMLELKPTKLLDVVQSARDLVVTRAKVQNIDMPIEGAVDEFWVMADKILLQQVFFNLYNNSFDAIKKNGFIRTKIFSPEINEGMTEKIMVEVSDNGCGMSEEVVSRIFEPFYTTKEQGQGTGLGLSTVYMIVEKHNGSITVRSQEKEGTTFTLILPAVTQKELDEEARDEEKNNGN